MGIAVRCDLSGSICRQIGGGLTFTQQSGRLYLGSDGKYYRGSIPINGFAVMSGAIDARPPGSLPRVPFPGENPQPAIRNPASDQYGSGGGFHDWYLIFVALFTLYAIMRLQPKWGVPLGYLVLTGAVLSTKPAVDGFNSLVKSVQTGSLP